MSTPETLTRELAALDDALAGRPVDPDLADLAELAVARARRAPRRGPRLHPLARRRGWSGASRAPPAKRRLWGVKWPRDQRARARHRRARCCWSSWSPCRSRLGGDDDVRLVRRQRRHHRGGAVERALRRRRVLLRRRRVLGDQQAVRRRLHRARSRERPGQQRVDPGRSAPAADAAVAGPERRPPQPPHRRALGQLVLATPPRRHRPRGREDPAGHRRPRRLRRVLPGVLELERRVRAARARVAPAARAEPALGRRARCASAPRARRTSPPRSSPSRSG